jgi:hypothetical protein
VGKHRFLYGCEASALQELACPKRIRLFLVTPGIAGFRHIE